MKTLKEILEENRNDYVFIQFYGYTQHGRAESFLNCLKDEQLNAEAFTENLDNAIESYGADWYDLYITID